VVVVIAASGSSGGSSSSKLNCRHANNLFHATTLKPINMKLRKCIISMISSKIY